MTPILRQWNATRYSRTIIYNLPTGFIQLIPAQFYSFYELTKIKCLHYDIHEALLKRAVAIVEKNMDNIEFSTDEFAREMNMSRSNLHLKLKAITGESTIDFIRKIRFNEAAKLLKDGRYTIAEVSTMVGFNTPSYFATSFKKYFGCLPTEYIKKAKG